MSYNPLYVGANALGTSVALVTQYFNNTGTAFPQGSPLSATGTSNFVALTDISSQSSVQSFVGYAQFRIPSGSSGNVISGGRLTNLQGYSFSIGNPIYMSVGGSLQNTSPVDSSGNPVAPFVSGDIMIFCGCIVQNESNPSLQDLQILTQVLGAL